MYVSRILYPVEVLGPGKRIGIWFCGCPHQCPNCSNPELWQFQERYKTTSDTIVELVKTIASQNRVDGFTITGGEPFYQYSDLKKLLRQLQTINRDILVFTGYSIEELADKDLTDISVLIDGRYEEEKNDNSILRGSSNQRIFVLDENVKDRYESYLCMESNKIQNFSTRDGFISVGIHKPKYSDDLDAAMKKKNITVI